MTAATIVAVTAAVLAGFAAAATFAALSRAKRRTRTLEHEVDRAKAALIELVAQETEARAAELQETLSLARAESISILIAEERRITEERRRDVAERERDASTKLTAALTEAQRAVEQRFADWGTNLIHLQQSLTGELERIGQRQQQLTAGVETKITAEAERLQAAVDEHRGQIAKIREDLEHAAQEVAKAAAADLETHGAERRRALQEVAERLRRRERELQEQIDREQTESTQRIATQLQDVERRQLEQVRRIIAREAQHTSEAAAQQFEATIRTSREESARRLGRELDLAVERFAREADGVLADRVEAELRAVEARLNELARRVENLSARI